MARCSRHLEREARTPHFSLEEFLIVNSYSIGPRLWALSFALAVSGVAFAQIDIGTTNAGDGANVTISGATTWNLAEATTSTWNAPPPVPGKGVYDPTYWAVVYKFGNLTINAGATLSFLNHPTNAPVVILVQGDFVCNGSIDLSGQSSVSSAPTRPGPGGFAGGHGKLGSLNAAAGTGPGGGFVPGGGGGSFGTLGGGPSGPIYGTSSCIPLIGGSGAAGRDTSEPSAFSGGAGGGAILIACRGGMTFGPSGGVAANGGRGAGGGGSASSGGSGGAIRLLCHTLAAQPSSFLYAFGGIGNLNVGGGGGVRIETNGGSFIGQIAGAAPSVAIPGATGQLWPLSTAPTAKVARVGSTFIGPDPQGGLGLSDAVVSSAAAQVVRVECSNVPVDGTWAVQVRVTPRFGDATHYVAVLQAGGTPGFSVWTVNVPFGVGSATVIARAYRIS